MAGYNADGTAIIDPSPIAGFGGLLEAVLGKQTNQNTTGNQNTTAATNTNASTTGKADTTQNTLGSTTGTQATTGATTGTQATTGVQEQTGSQKTTANNSTIGSQAVTGTVQNNQSGTNLGSSSQQTTADLSGLRSVYDRQAAGITPDMLAAIFQQGAKAAPQLITTQAAALGARTTNNSPVAQSLNMLNSELTAKAADINRQMLSDAGTTAGHIADLTRSVTGTTSQATGNLSTQINDLLTKNDSTSIINQLLATINNSNSSQNQTSGGTSSQNQTTAGTTNQNQTGTQTTAGTNVSAGTQTQNVASTEGKKTSTTINTGMAKTLLGLAAGGAGLAAIYGAAKNGGFTGPIGDLVNWLKGTGAVVNADGSVNTAKVYGAKSGWGSDIIQAGGAGAPDNTNWSNFDTAQFGPPPVDVPPPDQFDFLGGSGGFADGGQVPFLPIDPLIKKQTLVGNPDSDLEGMLRALGGGPGSSTSNSGSNGGATSSGATSSGNSVAGSSSSGDNSSSNSGFGNVGFSINDQGIAVPDSINMTGINIALGALGLIGLPGVVGVGIKAGTNAINSANATAADRFNSSTKDSNAAFNGAPTSAPTATAGPNGTGGLAASAASAAAQAATDLGYSDSAVAAAAQAAADASIGGATAAAASAAGAVAGAAASNASSAATDVANFGGYSSSDSSSGPNGGSSDSSSGPNGGFGGGSGAPGSGAPGSGNDAGGAGLADGGPVPASSDSIMEIIKAYVNKLVGNNPQAMKDRGRDPDKYADGGLTNESEMPNTPDTDEEDETDPALEVGEADTSEMMEAMGLAIDSNAKMMKFMFSAMQPTKAPGYANGGKVKRMGYADGKMGYANGNVVGAQVRGPGNGVSDSVAASGPGGRPIAISNGEVIIPTDVVQKFGLSAFEKLIAEHHVPADLQRAAMGMN